MDPQTALLMARLHQADLRGQLGASRRLRVERRSALRTWRDARAAATRARRRSGWVLVEIGLHLAVGPEAGEADMDERAA